MEQNHNMLRGISENGGIVFYGVDSTEIVREMERLHKTSAVTTAALGRLLTAASMMGIMLKSTQDSVTLQIKGGGPLAPSSFRALPIMDAPASARPRAAVATGLVWWICRARSVMPRLQMAAACTRPSVEIARTI